MEIYEATAALPRPPQFPKLPVIFFLVLLGIALWVTAVTQQKKEAPTAQPRPEPGQTFRPRLPAE